MGPNACMCLFSTLIGIILLSIWEGVKHQISLYLVTQVPSKLQETAEGLSGRRRRSRPRANQHAAGPRARLPGGRVLGE